MRATLSVVALIFILLLFPAIGIPANLSINPVRLFFSTEQKTSVIRVKNNSDNSLSLQIMYYSWAQDEKAEDQYTPTEDIILFPKILTFEAGEERIIRIGKRVPPGEKEKTYRIFLEEIPQPFEAEETIIRAYLKIGLPVFISPVKTAVSGEIENIALSEGNLSFTVRNKGNVHFIISSVKVKGFNPSGVSTFGTEVASRYLLVGHSRAFSFHIPKENCLKMSTLTIDIKTDRFSTSKRLDVRPQMCSP